MKIFVSQELFPKRTPIFEYTKENKIDLKDKIQFVFEDGRNTIKLFKKLYLKNIDSYFVVKNFENFIFKMRAFRNLDIELVEAKRKSLILKKDDLGEEIKEIAGFSEGFDMEKNLNIMVKKYIELEKKIKKGDDFEKGVKLSFFPKLFDSIKSSFKSPKLYLSEDKLCHKIYRKVLDGKNTLHELESIDENKESVHNTVKSMLFAGILNRKNDSFFINELLR